MDLTRHAQMVLDYYQRQFLGHMISTGKMLDKVIEIYRKDFQEQTQFLMDQGFTEKGAWRYIYKIDTQESEVL